MKRKILKSILSVICLLGVLCCFAGAQSSALGLGQLSFAPTGGAVTVENADGTTSEFPVFAFSLPISLEKQASGQRMRIFIQSQSYDFSAVQPKLLFTFQDQAMSLPLAKSAVGGRLAVEFDAADLLQFGASDVRLGFEGVRLSEGGELYAHLYNKGPSIEKGGVLVNGYTVVKQTSELDNVEKISGIGGFTENDLVYVISENGQELVRVAVQDGVVLGLAKRIDAEVVCALEYNFSTKEYVSVLGDERGISREKLLDVFEKLDFSFMRVPNEEHWLENAQQLSAQATFPLESIQSAQSAAQ